MSDAIELLEVLGAGADAADPAIAVRIARLEPAIRDAVLARDSAALARLLGGRGTMACAIFTPEPEEQPLREDEDDVPADVPGETEERAA